MDGGVQPECGALRLDPVPGEVLRDAPRGTVLLERRLRVLVQLVQGAHEVLGLLVHQGLQALLRRGRRTVVIPQVVGELLLTALRVPLQLMQVRV